MYYDDQARRFNVVSGLIIGTFLGAGVTLLVAPQKGVRNVRAVRRIAHDWRRQVRRGVGDLRGYLEDYAGR